MNRPLVVVLAVVASIAVLFGVNDPRVFASMPESIAGAMVSVAQFLLLFLILGGLWRLVQKLFEKARGGIALRGDPATASSSQIRLNGWQRIGVVVSLAWMGLVAVVVVMELARVGAPTEREVLIIVGLLFGPVLALWFGGYALVAIVRWVAAGFR